MIELNLPDDLGDPVHLRRRLWLEDGQVKDTVRGAHDIVRAAIARSNNGERSACVRVVVSCQHSYAYRRRVSRGEITPVPSDDTVIIPLGAIVEPSPFESARTGILCGPHHCFTFQRRLEERSPDAMRDKFPRLFDLQCAVLSDDGPREVLIWFLTSDKLNALSDSSRKLCIRQTMFEVVRGELVETEA